ncbi:MAG: biotin--[acetyl-CoA-carboxylase] ligase [Bdellovibrionota bacterium]
MIFKSQIFDLEVLPECGSTNEVLLTRRELAKFPSMALLALRQTAGQGRRGREWQSGTGNLALSVAFRAESAKEAPLYGFLIGLAAYRTVVPLLPDGLDLRLKWPNDIYLEGKKLAGILAQAKQQGVGCDLAVGIGLNLANAPLGVGAIALSKFAPAPSPESFALSLLGELTELLTELKDFGGLQRAWEGAAKLRGTELTIQGEGGSWRAQELLPTGELLVAGTNGETRKLASEEVSVRFAR